jgi:D-alanyl-D-alanine carboxypeptidase/D-alanyl-D-alanine-endopeptidase (penicillin-binding protein 4)
MLRFFLPSLLLVGSTLVPATVRAAGLPTPVARTLTAERLPAGAASLLVMDVATGQVSLGHEADTPRSPASTLKVITTFAALDSLGPAFSWHTRALLGGPLRDGVLDGDLILQGGGDPYLTLERWWAFARQLRAAGLRSIRGDIVVDEDAFALPPGDPGAFDGRPNRSYNVLPSALMVNFQSVDFRVAPNEAAGRVDLIADPAPPNLAIDNRIRLVRGRCSGASNRVEFALVSPSWDHVALEGSLSAHCAPKEFSRVLLTPSAYAYGTFISNWRGLGGTFEGRLRLGSAPAGAAQLLSFDSLSLGEVIRLTNKYSNNLMARHLLLAMGSERFGAPATVDKGRAAVDAWSRARGISLADVTIDNGSGLSREARVTATAMGAVLRAAFRSPYAPEFLASLPLGGIDGTLRTRMKGSPPGAVRLKTGHLDGVSAVAGYVTAASGRTYVVVSLINHPRADLGAAEPVHAALIRWVLDEL